MTTIPDVAPIVRMVLREAANRLLLIDTELATHLNDLAGDYAGPQVSDEDRKQEQR